ncbi:MAG: hypothetical protein EOO42_00045 [Flavobacteriales bacterium]|nr:MAG: hypothetical protein EOO42_00045 [Flavobacteriales bacterium]
MQNDKEKLLQDLLDKGGQPDKDLHEIDEDFMAYHAVYSFLNEKPVETLSYSFKSNLEKRLLLVDQASSDYSFNILIYSTIGIGFFAACFTIYSFADLFHMYASIIQKILAFALVAYISYLTMKKLDKEVLIKSTH